MRVCTTAADLQLPWGSPIGFVPTMGALHEGHLSLVRTAKEQTGYCVVSIFVNPTQFGPNEDFHKYPRPLEADLAQAESAGADVVYVPEVSEIYGPVTAWVRVEGITDAWEGEWRPGHFEGVTTVVAKLFNIVRPTDAFFGTKDLQQCAVISAMIDALKFPIRFHREPTLREADGLAMSSRNRYLSPQDRETARLLPLTQRAILDQIAKGEPVDQATQEGISRLAAAGFDVQYLAYVEPTNLTSLSSYSETGRTIVAAKLGTTRLIDNLGHSESF